MKKILLAVILFITFKGFAQDPQLLENTWYLENVILNNEDNFPPVNEEITEVTLEFLVEPYDFNSGMCNSLSGSLNFDDAESSFTFIELYQTLSTCGLAENSIYEAMYFNFYSSNLINPFTYNITSNPDSSRTLIVTSVNGDLAIYGSAILNISQFKISEIKTYPNPVVNKLTIEKLNAINNLKVRVYDFNGQLLFSKKLENVDLTSIDVTHLKSGIYFFVFESADKRTEIRKIIKK